MPKNQTKKPKKKNLKTFNLYLTIYILHISYTKIISKFTIYLYIKHKTMKLLQRKQEKIVVVNYTKKKKLDMTP